MPRQIDSSLHNNGFISKYATATVDGTWQAVASSTKANKLNQNMSATLGTRFANFKLKLHC